MKCLISLIIWVYYKKIYCERVFLQIRLSFKKCKIKGSLNFIYDLGTTIESDNKLLAKWAKR